MKNFKYLDDLIHSGTIEIVLDSDIILSDGEESQFPEGIELNLDGLIIDGNGYTIDANRKTRIFYCTGQNITIKNITLKNGVHDGYIGYRYHGGGSIYNTGNLKVFDSILFDNKSYNGGAIYNYQGELSIINSKLYKNVSKDEYSGGGGAIFNNNGSLNIVDCELYDNSSRDRNGKGGGAIHNSNGELNIDNSIFRENFAPSGFGGAIYNDGDIILQKIFSFHNVAEYGGFIHNNGNLKISNSRLLNNRASENGGAIRNYEGKIKISSSFFEENMSNETSKGGGAIYNSRGSISIDDSFFSKNSIKNGKGSVMHNIVGSIYISNSTFSENITQEDNFGLIYNMDADLTIRDSRFLNNKSDDLGILIYNDYGSVKIFKGEFRDNTVNNIIVNEDYLEIHGTDFNGNQCENLILNNHDRSRFSISNGGFISNSVGKYAIYHSGDYCAIIKTSFSNNLTATKNCQDIYNNSKLTLINPKIECDDKTILNEGKIFIKGPSMDLKQKIGGSGIVETNSETLYNESKNDFSHLDKIIHETDTKEIILEEDISLKDYEKDFYEGGIELDVDDLLIDGNGKTIYGADKSRIFIITGKNITLKNITFKNGRSFKHYDNHLNDPGGAIRINAHSDAKIINCNFIENLSESNAGALYNKGNLTIDNSKLCKNKITGKNDGGGAIFNSGQLLIFNSEILENDTSEGMGGAIFNTGILSIENSSFINNDPKEYGDVILNDTGVINNDFNSIKLPMNTCKFKGIRESAGGKLYISDSVLMNLFPVYPYDFISNWGDLTICDTIAQFDKIDENISCIFSIPDANLTIRNSNKTNERFKECIEKYFPV